MNISDVDFPLRSKNRYDHLRHMDKSLWFLFLLSTFKKNIYYNINFIQLPEELNDIINSFLTETVSIDIYIKISKGYPFTTLQFYIKSITCNKDFGYYLQKLYNYRTDNYNDKLKDNWGAVWHLDKNILDFVSTIFSDFDTVLHETFLYINEQ